MEEAYNELYQQYLRLRSLCLRQTAMLHQLTTALKKQQGAAAANGDLSDMMSIPVQCTQGIPALLHKNPQPPTAAARQPAATRSNDRPSKNFGAFSDLLAEDMSKLCMDVPLQKKDGGRLDMKAAPMLYGHLDTDEESGHLLRWQGASSSESKHPGQADRPGGDRTLHTDRMPVSDCPSQLTDFLSPPGGLLMSDVALQSHVCDFCQAVFPGDTTTRGEFLRHLHTHIT